MNTSESKGKRTINVSTHNSGIHILKHMCILDNINWVAHLFDHHFIEVLQALQLRKRADDAAIMKAEG